MHTHSDQTSEEIFLQADQKQEPCSPEWWIRLPILVFISLTEAPCWHLELVAVVWDADFEYGLTMFCYLDLLWWSYLKKSAVAIQRYCTVDCTSIVSFTSLWAFSFHFPILLLRPTERSKGANKFIFGASRFLSFNCYDNSHRLGKDNVFFSIDFIFPSI